MGRSAAVRDPPARLEPPALFILPSASSTPASAMISALCHDCERTLDVCSDCASVMYVRSVTPRIPDSTIVTSKTLPASLLGLIFTAHYSAAQNELTPHLKHWFFPTKFGNNSTTFESICTSPAKLK